MEATEVLDIQLSNVVPVSAPAASILTVDGSVTIEDNDGPATVSVDNVTVNEGDGTATVTVSLDVAVQDGFTVDYTTVDNSADGGDYTTTTGTLTFVGNVGESFTFTVPITDDSVVEATEVLDIQLSNVVPVSVPVTSILTVDGSVTIEDNDSATVSLTPNGASTISEGDVRTYTLALTGATSSSTDTTVDFTNVDGSAAVNQQAIRDTDAGVMPLPHLTGDYELWVDDGMGNFVQVTGSQLTIPAGQSSVTVEVRTAIDGVVELDESLDLQLTAIDYSNGTVGMPSTDPEITLGSPTGGITTITDNDSAQIIIKVLDPTASETALGDPAQIGQFTVRIVVPGSVTASNPLGTPAPVSYNISVGFEAFTGTAVNGVDYDSLPTSVSFAPGVTDNTINITPEFDLDVEGPETVTVTLDETSEFSVTLGGNPTAVQVSDTGDCDSSTIVIEDDDSVVADAQVSGIYVNNSLPGTVYQDASAQTLTSVTGGQWDTEFRDQVDGTDDGSTYGYELTSRADQLETIPWINVDELVVTFDGNVDISSLDLSDFEISPSIANGGNSIPGQKIVGGSPVDGVIPTVTGFVLEGGNAVRLSLSSVLDPSILEVNITGSAITFDGGTRSGTDTSYTFRALPGDVVESGALRVQSADILDLVTGSRINKSIGDAGYSFRANVDGNFRIQTADILAINNRLNDSLAPPTAPLASVFVSSSDTRSQLIDSRANVSNVSAAVNPELSGANEAAKKDQLSLERSSSDRDIQFSEIDSVFAERTVDSSVLDEFDPLF